MIGASRYSPSWCSWSMYAPITSTWSSGCRSTSALHHRQLGAGGRRHPVALLGLRRRVRHPLRVGQGHPDLGALGRGDPALRLDVLPRRVVPLRADQAEHVALAAVLADQGRGQAQPAAGLEVRGEPEDRRGQQVHLVVDDQAPVAGPEQVQVGERAAAPRGEHLVRGDGDRADLLALAGVLADLLLGQRGAGDQLPLPLPAGDRVGDQDQRGRLRLGHRRRADQGLARAAGQHHHARPAGPERLHRLPLVRPQRPRLAAVLAGLGQLDRVRLAVDVPGQVLRRPAQLEQRLLEPAPLGRVHRDRVVVDLVAEHPGELLALGDLDQHHPVQRRAAPARAPGRWRAGAGRTGPSSRPRPPAARAAPGSGST